MNESKQQSKALLSKKHRTEHQNTEWTQKETNQHMLAFQSTDTEQQSKSKALLTSLEVLYAFEL